MAKEQFDAARKRLPATLNGIVKPDLERLIAEVIWLKRRLYAAWRIAIAPIVEDLRR